MGNGPCEGSGGEGRMTFLGCCCTVTHVVTVLSRRLPVAQALVSRDGTVIAGEYYRIVTAPQSDSLPILPRRYSNLPFVKP